MAPSKRSCLPAEADDPAPKLRWEIWHSDTFDRSCPASAEMTGQGIIPGLTELWARYLFESVKSASSWDGHAMTVVPSRGFSGFTLQTAGKESVAIDGPIAGAWRLKKWVYGDIEHTLTGCVEAADLDILREVARHHAKVWKDPSSTPRILAIAETSEDVDAFLARLVREVE